jgi:hypothetical protein
MKDSEVRKGVKVFISDNPTYTAKTHTMIPTMTEMAGKEYTIRNRVISDLHGITADINQFWWHPKDLSLIKPITKKPELHYFDTKELVT